MTEEVPLTPPTASSSDAKAVPAAATQDSLGTEQSPPEAPASENDAATITLPHPPGSSASVHDSIADSVETATPTLGGSATTQVNVVNRGFTPRPSTSSDRPNTQHQFYANLTTGQTRSDDNESLVSRSTAQRTNFSSSQIGGSTRRSASRSHVPAIMPAYSFYHPLRPPAVAQASGQQQMPQTEDVGTVIPQKETAQEDDISSVHGKPSTEPLLPKQVTMKQEAPRVLHPVVETASNRTSMYSTHLLGTSIAPAMPPAAVAPEKNGVSPVPEQKTNKETRNWEHFPGKTKYHLNGRVQFGTQYFANIGTATLILIPTALYFAFTYLFVCVSH